MDAPLEALRDLAVPDDAVAVYAALVRDPTTPPPAEAAARLVELGLAQRAADGGVQPLPPLTAIGSLVRQRRRQLMDVDARLLDAMAAAEDLQVAYELAQERRGRVPLIELLHGYRSADATVGRLYAQTREVSRCFLVGPTSRERHVPSQADLDALARGLELRCIYTPTYLDEPGAMAMVGVLQAHGEQSRVHAGLPSAMLVFDEDVAVLPTDRAGHPSQGAAIIRSSSVVRMCIALFEAYWAVATPLAAAAAGEDGEDRGRGDHEADRIPPLLLAGFQDERIARELGVSVRTVRRRIRDLMDRHGAASRTQLGAALVRGGVEPSGAQRMS